MEKEIDFEAKMIFLGDTGVGKTSLVKQYTENIFDVDMPSSKGAFHYEKNMDINQKKYKVFIWDTTGEERFKTMLSFYYRDAHMIALVYSVISKESMDNLSFYLNQIQQKNTNDCVVLVVGNKIDQDPDFDTSKVPENVQKLCDKYGCEHIYTSAKDSEGVEKIFDKLIRKADELNVIENAHLNDRGTRISSDNLRRKNGCYC